MKKVLFYSSVNSLELFNTQKFYQIDIQILKELDYEVKLSNKIYEALFFWKYDFVFAYFYRKSFLVALLAFLFGKNTYFTGGIDSLDASYAQSKQYKRQKALMKLCYAIAKSCIIVSKTDLENVKKVINQPSLEKISYSEHTIDTKNYSIDKVENKELFFTTIVWQENVGNIKRKGVDTALKVFSLLKKDPEYTDYKFIIIGKEGIGTHWIKSLIIEYDISDSVVLTGEISEEKKIDYLRRSKYYFQLSLYEGFGLASLEALRTKNIVIHSKRGGLANPIFENGVHFCLAQNFVESFNLLSANLKNFDNSKLEIAYEEIEKHYSNERRKKDFLNIIKEV